jgi:hypothetical protein
MRHNRLHVVVIGAALAATSSLSAAAQGYGCCAPGPGFAYGAPSVPLAYPPTGYVLNPSDARAPIYVVNQGPLYKGPGIFAVPIYSEGGYAFTPYPYVASYAAPWYGAYNYPFPYRRYADPAYRPYGAAPYGTYFYRPQPGARVIDVHRRYAQAPRERRLLRTPDEAAPPPLPPARPKPGKPIEKWTQGFPPE